MYKLLTLFCVSLTLHTVYSAVAITPYQTPPPKYEGLPGCYNKDFDIMLPLNEVYSPGNGECLGYICQSNGETQLQSCGVVYAPNCTYTEDLSLTYPKCCKQYTCPTIDLPNNCAEEIDAANEPAEL